MIYRDKEYEIGIIRKGDFATVSLRAPIPVGATVYIDEEPWEVLRAGPSPYVDGVTNLWLKLDS